MASVDSTNFFKPAITAGRVNNSQNKSISRRNSSCGMGFRNFLAAARVNPSNFLICKAFDRATLSAWPSAASCETRPTACARVAFTLRPVNNKSRTKAFPRSRFNRRYPAESGYQSQPQFRKRKTRHLVRHDDVTGQRQLQAAAKTNSMYRGDSHKGRRVDGVQYRVNALQKTTHAGEPGTPSSTAAPS